MSREQPRGIVLGSEARSERHLFSSENGRFKSLILIKVIAVSVDVIDVDSSDGLLELELQLIASFFVSFLVVGVSLSKFFINTVILFKLVLKLDVDQVMPESHSLIGRVCVDLPVGNSVSNKDTDEVDVVLLGHNLMSKVRNVDSSVGLSRDEELVGLVLGELGEPSLDSLVVVLSRSGIVVLRLLLISV